MSDFLQAEDKLIETIFKERAIDEFGLVLRSTLDLLLNHEDFKHCVPPTAPIQQRITQSLEIDIEKWKHDRIFKETGPAFDDFLFYSLVLALISFELSRSI